MSVEFRPAEERDLGQIDRLVTEAFRIGAPRREGAAGIRAESRYVLADGDAVLATAAAHPVSQCFGGRAVPSAAVRSVAVSDVARGRGLGTVLMSRLLEHLRSTGCAVSVLYPSVPAPYRQVGYELAGGHDVLRTPAHTLPRHLPRATIEPWEEEDLEEIYACHEQVSMAGSGSIVRTTAWWEEIVQPQLLAEGCYRRLVRESGRVTGYLAYTKRSAAADLPYYYDLVVADIAWTTSTAAHGLLGYLGEHRALARDVLWPAPLQDPWVMAFEGYVPRVHLSYPWMLRLVDVVVALADRGYGDRSTRRTAVTVVDPLLRDVTLAIEVAEGRVDVTETAEPAPRIDVGALASLYTGWSTAAGLARAGRIQNACDRDLASLESLFAGASPWLAEIF